MNGSEWGTPPSVCAQCSGGEDSVGFRCRLHQALPFDWGMPHLQYLLHFVIATGWAIRLREVEGDLQEPQVLSLRSHVAAHVRHVSSVSPAYSGFVVLRVSQFISIMLLIYIDLHWLIPAQDFHMTSVWLPCWYHKWRISEGLQHEGARLQGRLHSRGRGERPSLASLRRPGLFWGQHLWLTSNHQPWWYAVLF